MEQAIAILLKRNKKIEQIRKIYIPHYKKFKPHITLVYPFKVKNKRELHKHINTSIKNLSPFRLSLKGLKKSTNGHYLYLLVNEGKTEVLKLYKKLNSGILKNFKNKEILRYIPHLSLGVFKIKDELKKAKQEIEKKNICFETKVDSIQLLTIDKVHTIKQVKNFSL